MRAPVKRAAAEYERANREAAMIVMQEPERYEGGLLEWAKACLERLDREDLERQGPLFRRRAA